MDLQRRETSPGCTILRADARRLPLPDASVDLIVTSPPYFALRSYTDGGKHYDGQVGAEPTPAEYIASLIECTREWARVLKPTGSIFVNLGDKYSTGNSGQTALAAHTDGRGRAPKRVKSAGVVGMQPKSLLLLPERYRIAAVDELGLIARAVLVWSKPNGLPESVRDRVRRSHEDWVHLTKQPRYFSAIDEIREPSATAAHHERYAGRYRREVGGGGGRDTDGHAPCNPLGKLPSSVWEIATQPLKVPDHISHALCCGGQKREGCTDGIDHFAAFPMEWPRRIIQGWSPSGICTACGEGRRPAVDRPGLLGGDNNPYSRDGSRRRSTADGGQAEWARRMANPDRIVGEACACTPYTDHDPEGLYGKPWREWHVAGWQGPPTRPAVVLDPFGGTGTTALVASVLGRHGISGDMSADYCRLAGWRTSDPKQRARAAQAPRQRRPPAPPRAASGGHVQAVLL